MITARPLGTTGLTTSVIGFGAWGIGGPAMAGTVPLGWGTVDDRVSATALLRAVELGITFIDTADFYGLGHSEELIGRTIGNRPGIAVATKVGHIVDAAGQFSVDYSRSHILSACEASLRRLRRDTIDLYQLHSARVRHLEQGDCIEAMELLKAQGKIRAWGLSLNTFHPEPEAEFLMDRGLGNGFQLVLNVINQRAVPLLARMGSMGYAVIARMPLQFGLLTGKFTPGTAFSADDHRSFRLPPELLRSALDALQEFFRIARREALSPTALSLSFCTSFPEVSTVIAGVRDAAQAEENASAVHPLSPATRAEIIGLQERGLTTLLAQMELRG